MKKQIIIGKKMKKYTPTNYKKEQTNENEKEKRKLEPNQNGLPLKFIVVYHDTNQDGEMESNKGCLTIKRKKSSDIFFNQRFFHQTSLLGIDSVNKFSQREWFFHSKAIDHPFKKKFKLARNEVIQLVLYIVINDITIMK